VLQIYGHAIDRERLVGMVVDPDGPGIDKLAAAEEEDARVSLPGLREVGRRSGSESGGN
jgi:hypothetical protein